jgi:hypothetical protein
MIDFPSSGLQFGFYCLKSFTFKKVVGGISVEWTFAVGNYL